MLRIIPSAQYHVSEAVYFCIKCRKMLNRNSLTIALIWDIYNWSIFRLFFVFCFPSFASFCLFLVFLIKTLKLLMLKIQFTAPKLHPSFVGYCLVMMIIFNILRNFLRLWARIKLVHYLFDSTYRKLFHFWVIFVNGRFLNSYTPVSIRDLWLQVPTA